MASPIDVPSRGLRGLEPPRWAALPGADTEARCLTVPPALVFRASQEDNNLHLKVVGPVSEERPGATADLGHRPWSLRG